MQKDCALLSVLADSFEDEKIWSLRKKSMEETEEKFLLAVFTLLYFWPKHLGNVGAVLSKPIDKHCYY